MRPRAILPIVAAALLGTVSVARADTDGWAIVGTEWWSQSANEAKFQEFREVPQGAFAEGFLLRQWNSNLGFLLSGTNAIREDQSYDVTLARGSRVRLDVGYQQIPHLFSQIARIGYEQTGPGTFLLPDSLQAKNQNSNNAAYNQTMNDFLNNSASDARLDFRTDILSGRLRARPERGWQFDVRASRRSRDGRKALGGSFGLNNTVEMVEPINQNMSDVDGTANWSKKGLAVRAGIGVSSFDNNVNALIWDNPKRFTDSSAGAKQGQLDLYPGNWALRGRAGMAWQIQPKTSLDAEFRVSRRSQDEAFLPFTVNSTIPQASLDSLPARSLNGEAVDYMEDVRLHSRVISKVTGTVRFNQHHYDNNTEQLSFIGRSPYDQTWTPGPFENKPFGNKQTTWGLDVDWDAVRHVRLGALAEFRMRDHTFREAESDEEPRFEVSASAHPTDALSLRSYYGYAHRYITDFEIADYQEGGVFIEQPGLRRFDVANRKQDRAGAEVDAAVTDELDLGVEYAYQRDNFDETQYGLQESRVQSVLGQATVQASERLNLSGGYGVAWPTTRQASNETGTAPPPTADAATDWWATIRDRSEWAYASADWWALPKKVSLNVSYTYTRDQTEYDLTNGAGTAQDLPDTFYRRHLVGAEAMWRARYHTDLALRYGYDYYNVQDFASQGVPLVGAATTPTGASTAIYLGDNVRPYVANMVSVVLTRRF